MAVQNINPVIEREARSLAADHRETDPDIQRVLWFPHDTEVRLIEFSDLMPAYVDPQIYPFYFPPSVVKKFSARTAIQIIRPGEYGTIKLPDDWGEWSDGIDL